MDWRFNIPIGSKIIINNDNKIYKFYGYNYDKTIVACFECDSSRINTIENLIYIPIYSVVSLYELNYNLEQDLQTLKI